MECGADSELRGRCPFVTERTLQLIHPEADAAAGHTGYTRAVESTRRTSSRLQSLDQEAPTVERASTNCRYAAHIDDYNNTTTNNNNNSNNNNKITKDIVSSPIHHITSHLSPLTSKLLNSPQMSSLRHVKAHVAHVTVRMIRVPIVQQPLLRQSSSV